MAAFERGMALGSDGIECDVHLSRDGVPVVIHDATLERTTDATGAGQRADAPMSWRAWMPDIGLQADGALPISRPGNRRAAARSRCCGGCRRPASSSR